MVALVAISAGLSPTRHSVAKHFATGVVWWRRLWITRSVPELSAVLALHPNKIRSLSSRVGTRLKHRQAFRRTGPR